METNKDKMIELKIFYKPEDEVELEAMGIESRTPIQECPLRSMLFIEIANIAPYYEDGMEFCIIASNSAEYICNMKYSQVKKIIQEIK